MITGMSIKTYFSIQHAKSAAYFCRRAHAEEGSYNGDMQSPQLGVIKAYASSALFLSAAFLEALVNELFADARLQDGSGQLRGLQDDERARISEIGTDQYLQKAKLLDKFKSLLVAAGRTPISLGQAPGQNVKHLVDLRNNLLHYKGPWFDMSTENMSRPGSLRRSDLYKSIAGKFPPRVGATPHSGDYWLGAGCAAWASIPPTAWPWRTATTASAPPARPAAARGAPGPRPSRRGGSVRR